MLDHTPRDDKGHFVPLDCPNPFCSAGKLVYEPHTYTYAAGGIWRCDGLVDPDDSNKELEACTFSHCDGDPYRLDSKK